MAANIGKIHSIETCGTVDGPGIRFVIFMQGCPLRCQYCHNPDTWNINGGQPYTVNELFNEIIKYKSYMRFSNGGVTVTGGEPLLQADFITELFKKCKANGIHTAVDTSGYVFNNQVKELLALTDLVILDIKNYDEEQYKFITGVNLAPTLSFLEYLHTMSKKAWIRYVLVPGLTDNLSTIKELAIHLSDKDNIERIEVLPFHKMGEYKWETLEIDYKLKKTSEPSPELVEQVINIFSEFNPAKHVPKIL